MHHHHFHSFHVTPVEVVFFSVMLILYLGSHVASRRRQNRIRQEQLRNIETYAVMSPGEFEQALAVLCQRDGCSRVRVTGGAGDRGADVTATTPDGRSLVIQAKHYRNGHSVGSPDMQRFAGTARAIHNADIAVLVTTSRFTKQALDIAMSLGIQAYDRTLLADWASGFTTPWR